jgi:hypothetical protein
MISRDKAPTAQETFMQMAQAAGLRGSAACHPRYSLFDSSWHTFAHTKY